ncbi:MAG TPA: serine hydrolase domain-containing protein [Bryobacteraceae bacterium]|nr:serine hydrolase domain-containing protein [Bryobacteraceae bacterium]
MDMERLSRIPARMQAFVDHGKAAGIVTLLARHGRLAILSAVGYQDRENKIPMRTDTIVQIMSMTKPITSAGIVMLMEEGRLSLVDPVEKYLPDFRGQQLEGCPPTGDTTNCGLRRPSRPINIRDLLTHTSGLPGDLKSPELRWKRTLVETAALASQQTLVFEPGTRWLYSNVGMATLGRIIEVVSGQKYEQFISERILAPLGMQDTFYFTPSDKQKRIAAVYTAVDGKLKREDIDQLRPGAKYAAPEGGLYSTAADMANFYQMMLNKGTLDGHRLLSAPAVELMTNVQTGDLDTGFSPGIGFGLGWAVVRGPEGMFRLNSLGTFGHGGAYRTYGWADPAKDMIGVILLQRTNDGGDVADEINSFMAMAAAAIER